MPTRDDGWDAGSTYEEFMGRWSRPLAREFVGWLEVEPGGHWLDVGAGTGALASAICAGASPTTVVACDPSESFLESARQTLTDPRVRFEVAGVGNLPMREGGYDAIVSGLAVNFFPDPGQAIEEELEAIRPGGLVGAYVWDYAEGMEFLRYFWDAAALIDPEAAEMDEGRRFPICNSEALEALFRSSAAEQVRVVPMSVVTRFSSFEDYWHPFLGGTGPAPSLVADLAKEQRDALAQELRQRLPIRSDGQIDLQARAWAVAGRRSS